MVQVDRQRLLRVTGGGRTRLAVLGSPIAHSQSPALHAAAYEVLGLPWTYSAIEVTESGLPAFLDTLDDGWRGLSLTMPLKRAVLPLLSAREPLVDLVGGANTVLITDDGLRGFNTDVFGIIRALDDGGVPRVEHVHVLGAGATAASVVAAVARRGALRVTVSARSAERAASVLSLAEELGMATELIALEDTPSTPAGLVVSTLPGGAAEDVLRAGVPAGSVLFDVAYDPWPSVLAVRFGEVGQQVVSGIEMLVFQALGQLRVFVGGDPALPLPDEPAVLAAMRRRVGL